jgi:hypothetical protein
MFVGELPALEVKPFHRLRELVFEGRLSKHVARYSMMILSYKL